MNTHKLMNILMVYGLIAVPGFAQNIAPGDVSAERIKQWKGEYALLLKQWVDDPHNYAPAANDYNKYRNPTGRRSAYVEEFWRNRNSNFRDLESNEKPLDALIEARYDEQGNKVNYGVLNAQKAFEGKRPKDLFFTEQTYIEAMVGRSRIQNDPQYADRYGSKVGDCIITIVDFDLSSQFKRLFVVDTCKKNLIIASHTSSGVGNNVAGDPNHDLSVDNFSNREESRLSSPGFYLTEKHTSAGSKWTILGDGERPISEVLLLNGIEDVNSNAMSRSIRIHAFMNFNELMSYSQGTPQSDGCFMLPFFDSAKFYGVKTKEFYPVDKEVPVSQFVIDQIAGGSVFYVHRTQPVIDGRKTDLLKASPLLKGLPAYVHEFGIPGTLSQLEARVRTDISATASKR